MAIVTGTDDPDYLDAADGITAGDDEIYALNGTDTIIGSAGSDYIDGGPSYDIVDYSGSPSAIFVNLADGGVGGWANGDIYVGVEAVIGTASTDFLIASSASGTLDGRDGNDTLRGLGGADNLKGGAGDDSIEGGANSDGIQGEIGNDYIDAGDGANLVYGGADYDTIVSGADFDRLLGEAGADSLSSGAGDDFIWGGAGADTMDGGDGIDVLDYAELDPNLPGIAGVWVDLAAGIGSSGYAEGDSFQGFENVDGTQFSDVILGDDNANKLEGEAGPDTVRGGAGADTVSGGTGDDVVEGGTGADEIHGGTIFNGADTGKDTTSYASSSAAVHVDLSNFTAAGGDAEGDVLYEIENLSGSAFSDTLGAAFVGSLLEGADGDDLLIGNQGKDTLDGGEGFDRASYANAAAGLTVDLGGTTSSGPAAEDTFISIDGLVGSNYADALLGNTENNALSGSGGNDIVVGRDGNDTLQGGLGGDEMYGGNGFDMLDYSDSGNAVAIDLGAGTASGGRAQGDLFGGVEGVTGSASADTLTGSAVANRLEGGAGADRLAGLDGNDTLAGGGGVDTLIGGTGNDRYVQPGTDVIQESANGGVDIVESNATFSLAALGQVERLILTGSASANGVGNALGNIIEGNDGRNSISGRDGNDTLNGGRADDTLTGGGGNDRMDGGAGRDLFVFGPAAGDDTILGFNRNQDRFDLSGGTFSQQAQNGVDTVLTLSTGGTLRIVGVIGLSLDDWNGLAGTARTAASAQDLGVTTAAPADALHDTPGAMVGHGDFVWL